MEREGSQEIRIVSQHALRQRPPRHRTAIATHSIATHSIAKHSMVRVLVAICTILVALSAVSARAADEYPSRPLRMIVPFPPGGPADTLGRIVAEKLAVSFGQPVVVDNRAGAGGNIGMEIGAKAAADGYTIVLAPTGNLTVNPSLYRNIPYNVTRDFAPVTVIATVPNVLIVSSTVPAHNVTELIRHMKAHPGEFNFSSPGNGSGAHLAGELFKSMAGVAMTHVPYNGIAPAVTAVVGGQVQLMFAGITSALPQAKGGKVRALGIASLKRSPAAPELPTLAESGLPGFDVTSWYGIVVPSGTPVSVINRLQAETTKLLSLPDVREKLTGLGAEPLGNSSADFAAMIRTETVKWRKIVVDANIKAE
jgi:tripartite-type tricarboxylate transporter receptor subunit TctC